MGRCAAASRFVLLFVLAGVLVARDAAAQGQSYVKEHYTKYEHRIPVRDGKRLFTAVYVPKEPRADYPILLSRTPYSCKPYGADQYRSDLGPSPLFGKSGYIVVYQDVRGRWMSEGDFENLRPQRTQKNGNEIDESTDTWDTVDWLVKNVAGNNGKVGIWGISYPGFYTAAGIIDAHTAIRAASPQAPVTDWFCGDDWHHHGAFLLAHCFNFLSRFGHERPEPTKAFDHQFDYETPNGYDFYLELGPLPNVNRKHFKDKIAFWQEVMQHGTNDEFWQARNIRAHMTNISPAVMTVGGWFDAENLFGALELYQRMESTGPDKENVLVMGPWRHGGWASGSGDSYGDIPFNSETSAFYRETIEFPFFEYHLKAADQHRNPEAWVFEMGANRWRKHEEWPPSKAVAKSIYLDAGGKLRWERTGKPTGQPYDEYLSDPAKPVPFINKVATGMVAEYMVADQRFAATRPDVLVYRTGELDEDVTIAGPIEVDLFVSTSGTDSDWIVKLIDVYPLDYPDPAKNPRQVRMGGYQQLVRGDVMRGKFRNSLTNPEPFIPNEPTRVRFKLQDTYHTFRSGHRIMVQVQSSWFPLIDRNPQQFVDIYSAEQKDFQKATQRVYRLPGAASRITVQVLP